MNKTFLWRATHAKNKEERKKKKEERRKKNEGRHIRACSASLYGLATLAEKREEKNDMMKHNATIYVKGVQSVDGEDDIIELTSEGTVETGEKGLRLCYNEFDDNGVESKTTLTLIGETVKIDRSGGNEMSMIIQKDKHRKCTYSTPMGALFIGTYGTHLSHGGNRLHLRYDLDMNAVLMSQNELQIKYIID